MGFNDGLYYIFNESKPDHISFKVSASVMEELNQEICNLRLTTFNQSNSDVLIFRIGYYNYMKLNFEYMVHKVTNDSWHTVDILIDWEKSK